MPKSPHPGPQSTWTSVLYACSVNFLASAVSGMRHHHFLFPLGQRRANTLDDLVAREGTSVVFEDVVVHDDAGVLGNQRAELRSVVVLDQHGLPRVTEDGGHRLSGERPHHADL